MPKIHLKGLKKNTTIVFTIISFSGSQPLSGKVFQDLDIVAEKKIWEEIPEEIFVLFGEIATFTVRFSNMAARALQESPKGRTPAVETLEFY